LNAVKEQILIQYRGLGWKEAHHPWSKNGITFSSKQCIEHLTETVIPLVDILQIPAEPTLKFPSHPELQLLGTQSELSCVYNACNDDELENFKTVRMQNEMYWKQKGRQIVGLQDSLI